MISEELNKSKEEIDVLLENLKRVETLLKAYKFDLESSREIIDELDNENKKLKKAIGILKNKLSIYLEDNKIRAILPIGVSDRNKLSQDEKELLEEVLYEQRIIRR